MDRKKIIAIVLGVVIVTLVVIVVALGISRNNDGGEVEQTPTVSANTVETQEPTEEPTTTVELPTPDEVKEVTNEGYVEFVYDPNESEESYFQSKVSIQGSGTVVNNNDGEGSSGSGSASSSGDITQGFWYEESEDKNNYIHAVTDTGFSNGFGPVMSVKYDISIEMIGGGTAILSAPNNTTVRLKELNPDSGDATYWREQCMTQQGFGYWASIIPIDMLEYDTPFIQGTGLEDWEPFWGYSQDDITVTSSGNQILCDISIDINFGEGYYFELVNTESGMFEGHMVIQHGDRVFYSEAQSEYRDSLKDICSAVMDRCITVY